MVQNWERNMTKLYIITLLCCCSVTKSCLTFHDPMDCNMPVFPVPHYLPEFAQIHAHWVGDASNNLILCCPFHFLLSVFPASRSFPVSQLFASCGQSIGASASTLVLPKSIQGWFPLRLTNLISLLSKGLSRVFSSTKFQNINSLVLCLLHVQHSYPCMTTWLHDY